ncbi:hypothetical protein OROGR_005028 [Orobanche gracilis]
MCIYCKNYSNAKVKMASIMSFCFVTTMLTIAITGSPPSAWAAEEFKVGGDEGWRRLASDETDLYAKWAATMRFHVGDSLRFEYNNDTVVVVDKWGYYHCNTRHAVSVFKDGNTVINLKQPGPVYFISANRDHCKNGQRLVVEVMTWHPIPQSPPQDDASSPAPSPISGAGSFSVGPQSGLCYVLLVAACISM